MGDVVEKEVVVEEVVVVVMAWLLTLELVLIRLNSRAASW